MGMQIATGKWPGTSSSKFFCNSNFQLGILNTCCEIFALSAEGKQQKYDAVSDILERKGGL
jgi:hypothetical protein